MRIFVIAVAVAMFCLGVWVAEQAKEAQQLRAGIEKADAQYHHLNRRILMLEHPELVRPFHRGVWESARR